MTYTKSTLLDLVKDRLDYLPGFTARDARLLDRINGVVRELERKGIRVIDDAESETISNMDDAMLVVDMVVWQHKNRDKGEADPPWLRQRLRDRWLSERRVTTA